MTARLCKIRIYTPFFSAMGTVSGIHPAQPGGTKQEAFRLFLLVFGLFFVVFTPFSPFSNIGKSCYNRDSKNGVLTAIITKVGGGILLTQTGKAKTKKQARPTRRKRLWILGSVLALLAALVVFSLLSPVPVAMLIRLLFHGGMASPPPDYDQLTAQVTVTRNVVYPSAFGRNRLDVYMPVDSAEPCPVVLWIHGGAFVGGDKSDIAIYATALAAQGYGVVCMNYHRAPEAQYPTPLRQVEEVQLWICDNAAEYGLDSTRLVVAGDSAGAHIAAQFALVQTSDAYATLLGRAPVVPPEQLKAALLFCGPFDVSRIGKGNNAVLNFMMGKAAWAYFGTRDWASPQTSPPYAVQASIAPHVTGDFPPAFIADGNSMSFMEQGQALAEALAAKAVPVETFFLPVAEGTTPHEFQFLLDTPAGQQAFAQTVAFLELYVGI